MRIFYNVAPNTWADKLTERHIEKFVKAIIMKRNVLYDPSVIGKALKGLRMTMHIRDVNAWITQFCSEFFYRASTRRVWKIQNQNFRTNDQIDDAVHLSQQTQRKIWNKCIDLNKSIWKDVKKFIAQLSIEAASCQSNTIQEKQKHHTRSKMTQGKIQKRRKIKSYVFGNRTEIEEYAINFPSVATVQRNKTRSFTKTFVSTVQERKKSSQTNGRFRRQSRIIEWTRYNWYTFRRNLWHQN